MIRLTVDTKKIEKLSRQLRDVNKEIMLKANDTIMDLDKIIHEEYESSLDELVYDQYSPKKYKRTYHLRGGHGAIIRIVEMSGTQKRFKFEINEESHDPEDGETWRTKADKVEEGESKMTVGFNRPFVDETQSKLVWQLQRSGNDAIRKFRAIIRRVGR